ncbi:Uncharacterised protein [Yersinia aldovae]|uniref:Uncharacterized protein n=1 Tax=Yersinia aldovae TaxID=29483 RepID=A0A0T9UXD8_YERAL|nr:Uncharacterised protein [Yersinia aldovae]CNL87252.1 Uncharacterised protein [Yersinia aldovae]
MVCAAKAVIAGQRDRRVGIDCPVATEHVRQCRIGSVQVQVAQHIDRTVAQRTGPVQGRRRATGNVSLTRQAAVGTTDSQIATVNIQRTGTGQTAGRR